MIAADAGTDIRPEDIKLPHLISGFLRSANELLCKHVRRAVLVPLLSSTRIFIKFTSHVHDSLR